MQDYIRNYLKTWKNKFYRGDTRSNLIRKLFLKGRPPETKKNGKFFTKNFYEKMFFFKFLFVFLRQSYNWKQKKTVETENLTKSWWDTPWWSGLCGPGRGPFWVVQARAQPVSVCGSSRRYFISDSNQMLVAWKGWGFISNDSLFPLLECRVFFCLLFFGSD